MKKALLSLAAVSAIAVAAPAAAQTYGYGYGYGHGHGHGYGQNAAVSRLNDRQANIAQRIDRAAARGQLTRVEVRRLSVELRRIELLESRYRSFGLTRAEINNLNHRLDRLQNALQVERRDNDRRYGYGYGRW